MKSIEEAAKNSFDRLSIAGADLDWNDFYHQFRIGVEFAQRWIDCSEELPKSQKKVLVKIKLKNGSEIETTAIYVAPKTVLASDFLDDYATEDLQEYDEEIDDYWAKEGWFEWHYYTEINYLIHDKIIGWRPIELK